MDSGALERLGCRGNDCEKETIYKSFPAGSIGSIVLNGIIVLRITDNWLSLAGAIETGSIGSIKAAGMDSLFFSNIREVNAFTLK